MFFYSAIGLTPDFLCILTGSGWAGTYFFIDPDTGVAAVFGTQIAPSRDPTVIKLFGELEEALYGGLVH